MLCSESIISQKTQFVKSFFEKMKSPLKVGFICRLIDIVERLKKEHTAEEIVAYICYMLKKLADIKG